MNLFQLVGQYKKIQEMADELDEMTLVDTLESIEDAIEVKIENTAKLIKTWEAEAKVIKEEENRLATRRKTLENKIATLKAQIQGHLEELGLNKVKTPTLTVSLRNNPYSVHVVNEGMIPEQFLIPQAPKVNKQEIAAALKEGRVIGGVELVRTKGVSIK